MDFETKKHILLTGAGFTKNFGGYLGEEMWARIYNNPIIQEKGLVRMAQRPKQKTNLLFAGLASQVLSLFTPFRISTFNRTGPIIK